MKLALVISALAVALTGCGGGGGSAAEPVGEGGKVNAQTGKLTLFGRFGASWAGFRWQRFGGNVLEFVFCDSGLQTVESSSITDWSAVWDEVSKIGSMPSSRRLPLNPSCILGMASCCM